jgi:hypothetical protein
VTSVTLLRDAGEGVTQECHDVTHECHGCHASESVTSAGQEGCNSLINSLNSHVLRIEDARQTKTAIETGSANDPKPTPAKTRKRHGYSPEFEAWWALYPRNTDKHAASKRFASALKVTDLATLTDGVQRYAREVEGRLPEHIKHAATWLHNRCWENGTPPPRSSALEWVRAEWQAGRARPIEVRTGLTYTPPDLPLDVSTRQDIEAFHVKAIREWINTNHELIIERLRSAS